MNYQEAYKNIQYNAITICIIEDDEIIRKSYVTLLQKESDLFVCGDYASFEEAQNNLAEKTPDVILLDVQLPGMRGVDAIPIIKKILPKTCILILTVHEEEEIIFTALKNGASGYLTKNTSVEKISESVKEIMKVGGAMSAGMAKQVMKFFQKNTDSPLTKRETEILENIAEGKSRTKIATQLFIDLETVKTHIKNIYHKLDVNSREDAIKVARQSKYI